MDSETQKTEILFGGGLGSLAFQMGFSHYLIELIGKEQIQKCQIGGISSGAAAAAYLYNCANSDNSIDQFYKTIGRKFYQPENKTYFGFITTGTLMHSESKKFYDACKLDNVDLSSGKYHFYYSKLHNLNLKGVLCDKFEDSEDFANGIITTSFIPGIIKLHFFQRYRGDICWDGGCTNIIPYKYKDSKKIFINILPDYWPFTCKDPPNCITLNINKHFNLIFPLDYWIWSEQFGDELFLKGYMTGIKMKQQILDAFQQ